MPGDSPGAAAAPCFQLVLCAVSLQALFKLWGSSELYPKDVLTYTELVLDPQGHLVQMNRVPGGNEVGGMIWEQDKRKGRGEAVLWKVGRAGGFSSLAVCKAWEMPLKQAFCLLVNAICHSDPISQEEPAP